jgi:hypothetical protein
MTILYSLRFQTSSLEGQVPVFVLQEFVAQLYPRALDFFFAYSYDSQGYGGGIRNRLCMGRGVTRNISENVYIISIVICRPTAKYQMYKHVTA